MEYSWPLLLVPLPQLVNNFSNPDALKGTNPIISSNTRSSMGMGCIRLLLPKPPRKEPQLLVFIYLISKPGTF